MKKIITCACLILMVIVNSYAQQVKSAPLLTREDYLKKSKNQKTGAVLLVVAGCTIGLVGGVISAASAGGNSGPPFPIVPVTLGVGCIAGGVTLSKASNRNKQKALEASSYLEFKRLPSIQQTSVSAPNYIGFTLKVALP